MDQELQFLINTLYGNRQLNDRQLQGLIKQWESDHNGFRDILRNQANSKLPATQSKGINPMLIQRQMNEAGFTTPKLVSSPSSYFKFDKNAGKAANDMSDITNFNDAFRKARQDGHKTFLWKKTKANPSGMFTTNLKSDEKSQTKSVEQSSEPLEEVDDVLDVTITPVIVDKSKINKSSLDLAIEDPAPYTFNDVQLVHGNPGYNVYGSQYRTRFAKGGTMNKIKYFAPGGTVSNGQSNGQADAFMQAVLQGDPQTIGQLVQLAASGNKEATQLIQTILQEESKGNQQVAKAASVIKQLLNQTTSAKWGSKLQYIRSLKFAKGGKTCPACMQYGGNTVKVAKKDVDTKTYQKQSVAKKAELDEHRLGTETSANKNGSYNTSHKPSAQDSTTIHRSTMSADMNKIYPKVKSKACGGAAPKAKKHYFGGWL